MSISRRLEWLVPFGAAVALLLATCIVSPHTPMWLDEVYSYYGVAHPDAGSLLESYRTNVNAVPPLYIFGIWAVTKAFPLSVLLLRVGSTLGCIAAVFLVWATLRRHVGFVAASLATLGVLLTSGLFLFHSSEARFYGLYVGLMAWTVYNYDRLCAESRPSTRRLGLNAASHALAVSCTHIAGCYSFAILLSLLLTDRARQVWRPRVYASLLLGWIPVLFYLPMIWQQRSATGWARRPGITAAFHPVDFAFDGYFVAMIAAVLAGLVIWRRQRSVSGGVSREQMPTRPADTGESALPLYVLSAAFLAVPYGFLLISWAGLPLLMDRYALPSLIGIVFLAGLAGRKLLGPGEESSGEMPTGVGKWCRLLELSVTAGLLLVLTAYPVVSAIGISRANQAREVAPHNRLPDPGVVMAASDHQSFFPRYHQSGENHQIFWIVPNAGERDMWQRFNSRLNSVTVDDFLATHDHFLLVSNDAEKEWMEGELKKRGGFEITTQWRAGKGKVLDVKRR
ncbi:MAG TPA: glycosyltransferase family 39 protein [Roseimicrobium sp.]|nr:glycosyltransferase family 39 protein [Roseimicrobium sp.]